MNSNYKPLLLLFLSQKTDVTYELVEELQMKTKEYLQPNPTARAKMAAVKGISKLSGQAKASTYPQPEGTLGECMSLYGKKLGDDSIFGELCREDAILTVCTPRSIVQAPIVSNASIFYFSVFNLYNSWSDKFNEQIAFCTFWISEAPVRI